MENLIEETIATWVKKLYSGRRAQFGIKACPLCRVFFKFGSLSQCAGCHIYRRTGITGCGGTPYEGVEIAHDYYLSQVAEYRGQGITLSELKVAFRLRQKAIRKEIEFLESLRCPS